MFTQLWPPSDQDQLAPTFGVVDKNQLGRGSASIGIQGQLLDRRFPSMVVASFRGSSFREAPSLAIIFNVETLPGGRLLACHLGHFRRDAGRSRTLEAGMLHFKRIDPEGQARNAVDAITVGGGGIGRFVLG